MAKRSGNSKTKLRSARDYARRGPSREPYDLVLIVCEGEKTEPHYFRGLRIAERLSSANVIVTPADGSDPMSVVQHAERSAANYDRTFCVFDRDGHANYQAALTRIEESALGQAGRLKAITSWPCFELWLLLHFRYSSAPIVGAGGRSPGEVACRDLRKHLPTYEKGHRSIYDELLSKRDAAIANGRRLREDNSRTKSENPSTQADELVSYLLKLSSKDTDEAG